jgi:hypothetical protein
LASKTRRVESLAFHPARITQVATERRRRKRRRRRRRTSVAPGEEEVTQQDQGLCAAKLESVPFYWIDHSWNVEDPDIRH